MDLSQETTGDPSGARRCAECGAPLDPGRECRELFYEILALEALVPGGPAPLAHFFAVASYNLQHPAQFQPGIVDGLRSGLVDALAGKADVAELRRRASRAAEGARRVLRRPEDPPAALPTSWPTRWPFTARDMAGTAPAEYDRQARRWAESVAASLEGRAAS